MILFLVFVISVATYLYFYATHNHDYWSKRNVKHDKPIPLFGNQLRNQCGLKSSVEISVEMYNKYPEEKVVGYYKGRTPELIIRDLEIAKKIITADFSHFHPRGLGRNTDVEPLLLGLFHVDGDTWKLLRQRLTSAFTSAKLKNMFPLIVRCANKLEKVGNKIVAEKDGICDVRELMARFTTEFIGTCGFGIEVDTINTENSKFRELGKQIFNRSWLAILKFATWELIPEIRNYIRILNTELDDMVTQIVTTVREQRNFKPSSRNDFIDLLLELESKGTITGESIEKRNADGTAPIIELEMNLKLQVAQVFVFFAAGFETSSSATSYMLHELAFNPEIQVKVQDEIDAVLLKYDNKLCYNAIADMTYLDMAFKESMRMFPSLGNLNRVCAMRYTIEELGITIDPGVKIVIPIQAIQNDEKYFDNPKEFRPERFTAESVKERPKYCYMPFGEGPRACIGARLGNMQSLAGLACLLHHFTVEPAPTTRRELEINHTSNVVQGVKNGIPLRLRTRRPKMS